MRREIVVRVIQMDKRTIDRRYALDHILQAFSEIVAVVQVRVPIQDDVDFHVQLVTRVVRFQALDILDALGETHDQVQKNITLVRVGCGTGQVSNMFICSAAPVDHNV